MMIFFFSCILNRDNPVWELRHLSLFLRDSNFSSLHDYDDAHDHSSPAHSRFYIVLILPPETKVHSSQLHGLWEDNVTHGAPASTVLPECNIYY